MKFLLPIAKGLGLALVLSVFALPDQVAIAQDVGDDDALEEVVVTGSRIRRDPLNEATAIMDIGSEKLDQTGFTNLGEALQNLPITGSAPNAQFNVPGNSGFPQDGAGIGAGGVQLSLRNLEAKRTLILVDGKRWIAGASASGVPSTVDLNTIPANMIKRVEILQDGASAIYGSDAIGGVINVITNSDFEGFKIDAQTGEYLSEGDGRSTEIGLLWGGGNDRTHLVFSLAYNDEGEIQTSDRAVSAFPHPFGTSCSDTGGACSSFTPQARMLFGPAFGGLRGSVLGAPCTQAEIDAGTCGGLDITLNTGVLNDGMGNVPVFDPSNVYGDDFHAFSSDDRFNYNGAGFNFIKTPNERLNFYASVDHQLTDTLRLVTTASYTNRTSATKAAPEPLCLGNDCGNSINDNFLISANNIYNPFGVDLSVALGTLDFFGRRPLESGPRRFFQDVNTYMLSLGLEGEFDAGSNTMYWDLTGSYGDNRGFQEKYGAHNAAKLQVAMGDSAVCAATPNCVPFNFFGGQGPNGDGSITQDMLDFVGYVQRDFSEQTMQDVAFNITGDLVSLPAGEMAFAAGFEYRDHDGSYRPDPIAERGETAGIPAGATAGAYDVTEFYGEVIVPLISGASGADLLEVSLAARSSDYSTSGSESTYKAGLLWRPVEQLSARASFSSGFRAPGIGELFGGAAREDFTFLDPCADLLGTILEADGGRADIVGPDGGPRSQNIIANCATFGVSPGLAQTNPQLSSVSQGNSSLVAETSDSWSAGVVWSPAFAQGAGWTEGITVSLDFYNVEIDDAIQGLDAGQVITACVETLDPFFCDSVPRNVAGRIGLVDNQLQNIGAIEASGFDLALNYVGPDTGIGQFGLNINATYLDEYIERTANPDGSETTTDFTGTHTNETFARAFPEWRAVTTVDWNLDRWSANLAFRWTDSMTRDSGEELDSAMFTDLQVRYNPAFADDAITVALGFNNLFDEDPPVCDDCSGPGMSIVVHDIPGTVAYLRVTYQAD
jgi:iron complex outermembrane receptor protein